MERDRGWRPSRWTLYLSLVVTTAIWILPTVARVNADRIQRWPEMLQDVVAGAFVGIFFGSVAVLAGLVIALNFELARVYVDVARRRVSLVRLGVAWSVAMFGTLSLLALGRDAIAGWFGSATAHLTSHRFVGYEHFGRTEDRARHDAWVARWDSGEIFWNEAGFVALCIALHLVVARALGRAGGVASSFALLATWILAFLFADAAGAVVFTYDAFFESVLTGQIVHVFNPLAANLGSVATLHLVFLALFCAHRVALRSRPSVAPSLGNEPLAAQEA